MIKKVLLVGLLTIAFGMPALKAQDAYLSRNNRNDAVLIQAEQNATLSTANRTPKKLAVAPQLAYNGNKLGAGLRLSYDFTDMLRFTVDGDIYFHTRKGGFKGRIMDLNPNVNLVFGNGDFHFYLIAGVYFAIGKSLALEELSGESDDDEYALGLGFNAGFGIEYQITDNFRVFFDQQASLGLVSSWMPKLGCAICL